MLQQVPAVPCCAAHGPRTLALDIAHGQRGGFVAKATPQTSFRAQGLNCPCRLWFRSRGQHRNPCPARGWRRSRSSSSHGKSSDGPALNQRQHHSSPSRCSRRRSARKHKRLPGLAPRGSPGARAVAGANNWLFVPLSGNLRREASEQWEGHAFFGPVWRETFLHLHCAAPVHIQAILRAIEVHQAAAALDRRLTAAELTVAGVLQQAPGSFPEQSSVFCAWAQEVLRLLFPRRARGRTARCRRGAVPGGRRHHLARVAQTAELVEPTRVPLGALTRQHARPAWWRHLLAHLDCESVPGPSGLTGKILRLVLDGDESSHVLLRVAARLARADVPTAVDWLGIGRLVAVEELSGGARGSVVGDFLRWLVSRTLAQQFADHFDAACLPYQFVDPLRRRGFSPHFASPHGDFSDRNGLVRGWRRSLRPREWAGHARGTP